MIKNQKYTKKYFSSLVATSAFALLLALVPQYSYSEYRVYQYWVKSKTREKAELVTTSLDPSAYLAYYGNEKETSINLMRSWICYGDTGGHKPPCRFEESISSTSSENIGETVVNETK